MISRHLLTRLGYEVVEATDCADAEVIIGDASARIDLLVSDINLPDGSGMRLGRHARTHRPGLAIVWVTLAQRGELGDELTRLGGTFLAKPFLEGDLRAAIARSR